jgi:aspartate/methionine/tyrosine aminotransferase
LHIPWGWSNFGVGPGALFFEAGIVALPLFLTRLLIRTGIARFLPWVQRLTEGGGDFLPYYSDRILTAPYADLQEVATYVGPHGPDVLDLGRGTPLCELDAGDLTSGATNRRDLPPAQGLPELRLAVAEHLAAEQRLWVRPADEVLITQGATGAFSAVLESFINPGDRVVVFDPTSPMFLLALRYHRARIRWVATRMEKGCLRFRLDHLARALRRARLVVVNSPANPTGGVIAPEDLEQIAWWARHHDVLVYSDEVFASYQYDDEGVSIGTLPAARQRTLTVGSVSQGHGLASLRVGWLAGYRHLIRPCILASALQALSVPALCQDAALAALRRGPEPLKTIREEFRSRRQYVYNQLRSLGLEPAWPAGAYVVWVPVSSLGLDGSAFADRLLMTRKVLVWPGEFFGPQGAGHIRISYAASESVLREGLSRLADLVGELQGKPRKTSLRNLPEGA